MEETKVKQSNVNTYCCKRCNANKTAVGFVKNWVGDPKANVGVIPYCKKCIKEICNDESGKMDIVKTLPLLKEIDKPYRKREWDYIINTQKDDKGIFEYLKRISLGKLRILTWKDGDLESLINDKYLSKLDSYIEEKKEKETIDEPIVEQKNVTNIIPNNISDFEVTKEIVDLFGNGFTKEEYEAMMAKYMFLKENYSEQTSMHTEALITYVRYKVREEMAIAKGDAMEAKTWGELAMKQADKAKINPYQFSKADLQGGLSTIGEIVQAVEQNQDIIPILPRFKYRPNDAVDFCIWNYINYARNLEGKPLIEYSEIYQFYDRQKENFIETTGDPYGIFDDDTTEHNREKIEKFIAPFEEEEEN